MQKRNKHIIHILAGIFLVVLTVANATAQIAIEECDTMEFSVTSRPGIPETHFVWGIYEASPNPTDVLDPAGALDPVPYFVDGMYAGSTVQVTGLDTGVYYVRIHVWDEVTCTDNIEMYVIEVLPHDIEFQLTGDSLCIGEPAMVKIVFSGTGPYNIEYSYGDGTNVVNLNGISEPEYTIPITDPLPVGENSFWIISVEDDCKAIEYDLADQPRTGILIYPKPSQSRIYLKDD